MTIAFAVFIVSLAMSAYIYFGYPALIFVIARMARRSIEASDAQLPSVSIVIPAYNEEAVIEAKLHNTRELEYPPDLLEVVVVSDGSTDRTNTIVAALSAPRVRLLALKRRGKANALNAGVGEARGDVIVFTDANSMLELDAVRRLARNFADPEVGGVCGNRKYRPAGGDATAEGEGLYWRYDKWQKTQETRIGSIFAADGTLHAVRRSLYVPIGDPAQADDIAISTRVVLQGYRLVYEPAAIAWEEAPVEGREEFRRKIRVTNHSVRALLNLGPALWRSGFYSVELLSHKLLRHLAPFFLIPLLLSNLWLAPVHAAFASVLVLQLLFYGLAVAGLLLRATGPGQKRLLAVPYYFGLANAAALLGVLSIAAGRRQQAWIPRQGLGMLVLALAPLAWAGDAAAQTAPVQAEVRVNTTHFVNFFQAADLAPQENVWARALEARLGRRPEVDRVAPFARVVFESFGGLGPAGGLFGGVMQETSRGHLGIEGGYQWNRPRFDVGDEFERANIASAAGEYAHRITPAVELRGEAEYQRELYDVRQTKNNHLLGAGGAVRYRGFGSDFSPEVGWLWGARNAVDANEDYRQRTLYVQLRSAAIPATYLSVRYRHRFRDYLVALPGASNVAREDRRQQWAVATDVTLTSHLVLNVYFARERAESTRATRTFTVRSLTMGLTYAF